MTRRIKHIEGVKTIILAGSRDFGRCSLASRLPTALWPVAGETILQRLLDHLYNQGINDAVICSTGDVTLLQQSIKNENNLNLTFLDEPLPKGTAGCIRDATNGDSGTLILVFHASVVSPPDVGVLLQLHKGHQSDLTVMLNPDAEVKQSEHQLAGIYVCEPTVLEHIPKQGYFDIKEGLIPALTRAGKVVGAARLPRSAGNFRDGAGYLSAVADYLRNSDSNSMNSKSVRSRTVRIGANTKIDPAAQIYGPVVIMDGATVSEDAVILGPSIVGQNVKIGKNCLVADSILWDGARLGPHSQIQSCVLAYDTTVPSKTIIKDLAVAKKEKSKLQNSISKVGAYAVDISEQLNSVIQAKFNKVNDKLPNWIRSEKSKTVLSQSLAVLAILAALLWSYWPQAVELVRIWSKSDEYSSGLLVPFLAIYVVWSRRHKISRCQIKPSILGFFALLAVQGLRYFGLFFMYSSAERFSLVASIAALVLLLFGWRLFCKVATVLLFLNLMLPLPRSLHSATILPLQNLATASAVFCLQVMGYEAVREGNIVHLNGIVVAVSEACNGLRMVTAFVVISALVVLVVRCPLWEKVIVLASSLPIGLMCNTIRLTITAIAFTVMGGPKWEKAFHDFLGLAMMPLALLAVVLELRLLAKLLTVPLYQEVHIKNPTTRPKAVSGG